MQNKPTEATEPYDLWPADKLGDEIERLKVIRDTTNRLIEDLIDKRCRAIATLRAQEDR